MWKWLRSWFAWRFSLRRLVVATVFLGAVAGLNMKRVGPEPTMLKLEVRGVEGGVWVPYYHGWPFPYVQGRQYLQDREVPKVFDDPEDWLPVTHSTYRMWNSPLGHTGSGHLGLNVLFALTVLSLILFFHPRRKPSDDAPA